MKRLLKREEGFTMMEVLVAIMILTGIVLFVVKAMFPAIRVIYMAGERSEAAFSAQGVTEQVLANPASFAGDSRVSIPKRIISFYKEDESIPFTSIEGKVAEVTIDYANGERELVVKTYINP